MSNLSDVVGGANMYNGTNYTFAYDRFCNAYSAINFSSGYLQVPPGIYFSGEFAITAWIYLLPQQTQTSRIIDFGNGPGSNNILFSITGLSGHIYANSSVSATGNTSLNLNKWYHVAFFLQNLRGSVFVNGNLASRVFLNYPVVVTRNLNYIGKSNWATHKNAYAIFDDLKIYQGASETQIVDDFKLSSNSGLLKNFNINKIY
jgi:hypothetical protein